MFLCQESAFISIIKAFLSSNNKNSLCPQGQYITTTNLLHTLKVLVTNLAISPSTSTAIIAGVAQAIFLSPASKNTQHSVSAAVLHQVRQPVIKPKTNSQNSRAKMLTCGSHSISVNCGNTLASFNVMSDTFGGCLN